MLSWIFKKIPLVSNLMGILFLTTTQNIPNAKLLILPVQYSPPPPFVSQNFIEIAGPKKIGIMLLHEDEIRRGGIGKGGKEIKISGVKSIK